MGFTHELALLLCGEFEISLYQPVGGSGDGATLINDECSVTSIHELCFSLLYQNYNAI